MTKTQYERLKDKEFFDTEINKEFLNLKLKHLYIFGNPDKEESVEGNLFYNLGNSKNFVSWFSGKKPIYHKFTDYGGGITTNKRFVSPLNPATKKLLKIFHNSKYIDEFIKESILEAVNKKEAELTDLPF
jgi:hypothetical protein